MNKVFYILMMAVLVLNIACANIGTPDGGPYDEDPPKLIGTSPEFGSLKSKTTKVVLEFDENVKLDNANEKVIISPPQREAAEIEASGRRITVALLDTLKENMTYTIDFADAIEDNNEGNPMGDYAFTFSTGETIDTMQVSGYVLEASNLEPIKGIAVGLYDLGDDSLGVNFSDTIVKTREFERISRTDSRGHFVIKGVSRGFYKIYAVKDQDQTYTYSQRNEQIAFTDRILHPWSRPDVRADTIWHDSIHYESITYTGYTHFYPDDIVLTAFTPAYQDRQLLKTDRPSPQKLTVFFTAPCDSLPVIRGLNYDSDSLFVVDSNIGRDTITYWIRDSLVFENDTLVTELTYLVNDTAGLLVQNTDTITFIPKVGRERRIKLANQEYEDYVKEWKKEHRKELKENPDLPVPPKPEVFLEAKIGKTQIDPDRNIDITFDEPLAFMDSTMISFFEKVDTLFEPREFIIEQDSGDIKKYHLYAEWQPGAEYQLQADTGAVVSIYGKRVAGFKKSIKVKALDTYSTLFVKLHQADSSAIVELLNSSDKVVKSVKAVNDKADFYFITPGTYYLRLFYDCNGNGQWDTGDYDKRLSPEPVYYYPKEIPLKANWEITEDWYPEAVELFRQKLGKITKQKADKAKQTSRHRNEERLKNKKNGKKPQNNED